MADGPADPDPDDGGRPEDGPILSPDELDITNDEHVEQLDEGRFVVSPDARVNKSSKPESQAQPDSQPEPETEQRKSEATSKTQSDPNAQPRSTSPSRSPELSDERVHKWLQESFEDSHSRYGFDVTATFDGKTSQRRMASNDVVTIFESLILWYAQQIDSDTPVEEILGILLMEANVPIRYPPESLKKLVKSTDLGPDDTIADLLAAVDEDDGVKL